MAWRASRPRRRWPPATERRHPSGGRALPPSVRMALRRDSGAAIPPSIGRTRAPAVGPDGAPPGHWGGDRASLPAPSPAPGRDPRPRRPGPGGVAQMCPCELGVDGAPDGADTSGGSTGSWSPLFRSPEPHSPCPGCSIPLPPVVEGASSMRNRSFVLLVTLVLLSFAGIVSRPAPGVCAETYRANGLESSPNKGMVGGVPDSGDPDVGQTGTPKTTPKLALTFRGAQPGHPMTVWIRWARIVWTTRSFVRGF